MRDRENPDLIAYLEAENEYLDAMMAPTRRLQETLFDEMKGRMKQDDQTAPFFSNGYYYYIRYEVGGEYPIYCRRQGTMDAPEEVILDVNELARPYRFFNVGRYDVSLDNRWLAFSVDTVGRRQYTIMIKDLDTEEITQTGISHAGGDVVWAADNQTLFFSTLDPVTLRYERVHSYNFVNGDAPREVYYEADDTFYHLGVSRSKDNRYIMISANSTLSNETWLLEADRPDDDFRVFHPRTPELLYRVYPYDGKFYVLTNLDASNFRLMETTAGNTGSRNWREKIAHREDVLLETIELFDDYIVLQERSNALRHLRIMHLASGQEHYLEFPEEAYTANIGVNAEMSTNVLRYNYTSLTTPNSNYDYNMETRETVLVKQQEVLGDFDPANYETRRYFVTARDGVEVPLTLVYRQGIQKDGESPLLLHGYGSYGASRDPRFNANLLSLLDRGFVYAIAHIRGGQEMGRHWYDDGKLLNKWNTFYDFIDCGDFLVAEGYTRPEKMFASGGSAGGLLVGTVINERPELFKGVVAAVPFVDVVTTMLDETIPLTTAEYDEWGNPNNEEYYWYMLSYSPYDNVSEQDYPNLLVTSGLHDSQVQYWEPTKWVAKLRDYHQGDAMILLQTNMEAGHGGASGRFQRLREIALQYAFFLDLANE
jgi:oligopeptidase B